MPGPNYLEFYDALSGKLVNSKQVIITSRTWEKLSDDHKIYALGYNSANSGELHLFDVRTGAELWNNKFKNTFNGLMMSGDGKWFAAVFAAGPGRWRIALLDAAGGEAWSEEEKTENSCAPVAIAADGSSFEIRESRLVYSKETDRSQRTEMNRTRYKNSGGKVERTGSSAGGLTQEHKPVEEEKGARHD